MNSEAKTSNDKNSADASWNSLTQAKFIYEINRQMGNPISWQEAYSTAELAVCDLGNSKNNADTQ